jgi:hypothetical protein
MNKSDAQDVSQRIARVHAIKFENPDLSREVEHRVHRAVHDHLHEMFPADGIIATLDEATTPKVVALSKNRFYELTVGEITEQRAPVPTLVRMRAIDPMRSSVDCEVKYSGHRENDLQVIRETVWRFQVDDIDLEIETYVDRQRNWIKEDEKFALALAQVIGWDGLGSEGPLMAVA